MASVDIVSPTEADVRRRSQMEQYFQQMKRLLQYQRRGAYNGSNWLGLVRIQTSSHDFNEREILIVIWKFDPFLIINSDGPPNL